MKALRLQHSPLRTRFMLGMGVMLLPLVVLAVGALFSLQGAIRALDGVVKEASEEIAPLLHLEILIHRAAIVMHDYVRAGRPGDRELFLRASRRVDKDFEDALKAPFGLAEERALVRAAREEWQRGQSISKAILGIPRPVEHAIAARELERFQAHVDRATDTLDQIRNLAQGEMARQMALAYSARRRALVIIATVFALGLGAAILVGTALARSILLPLRILEEGADRFGAGDLSHRVSLATQDELEQLGAAFNGMAEKLAKSQKALEDLSSLDGLTGLYNYREFHLRLAEEVQRSWRYGRPFSLLILDIDDFKVVNDTYGHLAGDEALRGFAALIRREVRPADEVARYGGEEFAILLAETPGPGALAMAERIRDIIATHPIALDSEQAVDLTVSIGVATYPQDAESGEKLISAADKALYAAKNGGRNRVCRWGQS